MRYLKENCYIDGEWRQAESGRVIEVKNPADRKLIAKIPECGPVETEQAISAAERAFPSWRALTAWERGEKLNALYELILKNKEDLARILTLEQGKPLTEAQREIVYGAAYIQWYAEEGKRIYGEVIPSSGSSRRVTVLREPVGVCAAITPWSFPQAMLARKMAPALAAGCTFISKPDDKTPLSALALAALSEEAGIPRGVFNVVTGQAAPIAETLMASDIVRKLSFTGSTRVGRILIQQSAQTVKKLTLELGGNAPFIVFADADLPRAVKHAVFSKFRNAGQTCVCTNRFLVQHSIAPQFIESLTKEVQKLKVGSGLDQGVDLGPLISDAARNKVCDLVSEAMSKGAKAASGSLPKTDDRFMQPLVVCDVTPEMRIFKEEIFGPVASVTSFDSEDEALALANGTEYGLAAYFFTKDVDRIVRVQEALQYGMIGVNESAISAAEVPFGGVKHSGFGREGGRYGIEEYLNIKYVCLGVGNLQR